MVRVTSTLFALVALALSVVASPARRSMKLHERREAVPSGFAHSGTPNSETLLSLRIVLTPQNLAGLEEKLLTISDPSSDEYGEWLTLEEVQAFASPSEETTAAVKAYLAEHGITDLKFSGIANDWVSFSAPVETANTLFSANFQHFTDVSSGKVFTRTLEYSIPKDLDGKIELVHPTISFAQLKGPSMDLKPLPAKREADLPSRALSAPASCATVVTPTCLQDLYGIPTTAATTSTRLGVLGFIDQWANQNDLKIFLQNLRTDISSSTTFTLQTFDGGSNPQVESEAGIEADLDIEYTVGIATGVPITFFSVGESNSDSVDGFQDAYTQIAALSTGRPSVLTTSYGFDEQDLGSALATSMCNTYMSVTSLGISLLFSSGDGGVSGSQSQTCTTFIPTFPGGCPWITSVGGTTGIAPEVAVDFSSGGFSNFFTTPSYQATAVSKYLSGIGSTNAGKFNASGRGFPDIAAIGDDVEIRWDNEFGLVGGTSCSSPISASVISLINDRLVAAGKPVLGFLNPFIYSNTGAFFDITSGSNPGCGTNGFSAAAGWDPITGNGSPNFAALLSAVGL